MVHFHPFSIVRAEVLQFFVGLEVLKQQLTAGTLVSA